MRVLFICVENTCRSQMAEGFALALGLDAESAGLSAGAGVNPEAVKVMAEIGVDISNHKSKSIDFSQLDRYDTVISLCSANTADLCPASFLGTQANWNVDDPKGKSVEEFRRIRDEIQSKVGNLVTGFAPSNS